jgi:hypothetical protein
MSSPFCCIQQINGNWDSSIGALTDTSWTGRVRVLKVQNISLLYNVQTDSGAYPASCRTGTVVLAQGVKWQGSEADHLSPSSAEVKKVGAIISTPPCVFMAYCLTT